MTEQVLTAAAEMAEARAKLEEAEAGVLAAMDRALAAVQDAVDGLILQSGFTRAEVLGIADDSAPKKARRRPAGGKGWALVSDPGKVYVRGRMPAWLAGAMQSAGMNPDDPGDRAAFRGAYMLPV